MNKLDKKQLKKLKQKSKDLQSHNTNNLANFKNKFFGLPALNPKSSFIIPSKKKSQKREMMDDVSDQSFEGFHQMISEHSVNSNQK
jgi:hypothetical protein